MSFYIRLSLIFFSIYAGFVAVNAAFAAQMMSYAITSCAQDPNFFCYIFDIIHEWYWLAALALSASLALVITFAVKRNAA